MTDWKWLGGPATGGHDFALTLARSRQVTFRLTGTSDTSFTIDGRSSEAAELQELSTDVHVLRDDVILGRFRVGKMKDTLTADAHTMTVPAVDYRGVLARRMLHADSVAPLMFSTPTEQSDIAWALVNDTQRRPGGDLGIARGSGQVTGQQRVRQDYKAGQMIGSLLSELAGVENGFDFDIVPTSASGLALNIYYQRRGQDRGVVVDYGGAFADADRQPDTSTYANAIRWSGADTTTAQEREAADIATRPEGRWESQAGDPSVTLQSTVNEHADADLTASQTLIPAWTVTLTPDWWQGPSHVWLGDPVLLVCYSGRLRVESSLRVQEINVTVDDSGVETVRLTLGSVDLTSPGAITARALATDARLSSLERR